MSRQRGSNSRGGGFSKHVRDEVWKRSTQTPARHGSTAKDCQGRLMKYEIYGNPNSRYGWEIDHKRPVSKGGSDRLTNLQALNHESNRKKGDS